jgi:hypothetical protein
MTVAIIKSGEADNLDAPEGLAVYGQIRLWIEGDPPKPTPYWLIIGDFALNDSPRLLRPKLVDANTVTAKRDAIFAKSKVQLSDYSIAKRRSFHMDIHVTQAFIDGYLS